MKKENIKIGHTNKVKYRIGNEIVIKKTYTGFNHKIDYSILDIFDFVPKLIRNNAEEVVWEYVEGEMLSNPTSDDLKQVGKILRTLHKTNLKFPKNNFRDRYREYIKIAHNKNIKLPEIENNWKKMNKLVTKMQRINACHNDVWWENLIKDKSGKIWLVDWEYATMGDKHFDLAYFIESSQLDNEQEKIFLNSYNSHDNYQAWIPEWLPGWKTFVNWLTLTWIVAQHKEPFSPEKIKKKLR